MSFGVNDSSGATRFFLGNISFCGFLDKASAESPVFGLRKQAHLFRILWWVWHDVNMMSGQNPDWIQHK